MTKATPSSIEIRNWESNPKVLLHMTRTFEEYKKEINQLESHIEHLKSIGKNTDAYELTLQEMINSKELLKNSKADIEFKLWSKKEIKEGDIIKRINGQHVNKCKVVDVIENRDHSGIFDDIEDSKNTFYVLHLKFVSYE